MALLYNKSLKYILENGNKLFFAINRPKINLKLLKRIEDHLFENFRKKCSNVAAISGGKFIIY